MAKKPALDPVRPQRLRELRLACSATLWITAPGQARNNLLRHIAMIDAILGKLT